MSTIRITVINGFNLCLLKTMLDITLKLSYNMARYKCTFKIS